MTTPPPVPTKRRNEVGVVTAQFDFDATRTGELSVKKGETLYIINKTHEWWTVKKGNLEQGLVPAAYLEEAEFIANPLHEAAKRGNVDWIRELLQQGVSVNLLDASQNTALHWASRTGHLDCVMALLYTSGSSQGAVVLNPAVVLDQQNLLGDSPLHLASFKGSSSCVRLLIDAARQKQILKHLLMLKNRDGRLAEDLATNVDTAAVLKLARLSLSAQAPSGDDLDYDSDD